MPTRHLLSSFFIAVAAPPLCAQTPVFATIVPPALADVEGDASTAAPFGVAGAQRVMFAYDGALLGHGRPLRITAIELRPDAATAGRHRGTYTFSLSCSTGRRPAGALSPTFDDNHGGDLCAVFAGFLDVPAPVIGTAPSPFALRVPFARPFDWDPRLGPLVLDLRYNTSRPATDLWDAVSSTAAPVGGIAAASAVATTATATLGLAPVVRLHRQDDVLPSGHDLAEGAASDPLPFNVASGQAFGSGRLLAVYEPPSLPLGGRVRIDALAWRTDAGQAWTGRTFDLRVALSTSPATAATLSPVLDDNHGPDRTVVFDGTFVADPHPASGDLRDFDLILPLQRPFEFDPAQGSLAVDVLVRSAVGPTSADIDHAADALLAAGCLHAAAGSSTASAVLPGVAPVLALRIVPLATAPAAAATAFQPGNSTAYPFGIGLCRSMSILTATDCGLTMPIYIQHLRFRPDDTIAELGPVTYTCTIDMSNPGHGPAVVSGTFDANHGLNRRRVFDGRFSVPYLQRRPGAVDFPVELKLQQPFVWDPINPWLTIDLRITARAGDGFLADTTMGMTPDPADARVYAGNPDATTGIPQQITIVMQFGGTLQNGLAVNEGTGCAGSNGVPQCTTVGLPSLPQPGFGLRVRRAAPSAPALLLAGFQPAAQPLPGLPQCLLRHGLELGTAGLVVTDPTGDGTLPLPLPDAAWLHGFAFRTQWAVLDPQANALGVALSDGQQIVAAFF